MIVAFQTLKRIHPFLCSLNASAGAEYKKMASSGLCYRSPCRDRPCMGVGRVLRNYDRNSGQRTEFVEVATQFERIYLIHIAIYGCRYMPFGNRTTNISKSRGTVRHETPPFSETYQFMAQSTNCVQFLLQPEPPRNTPLFSTYHVVMVALVSQKPGQQAPRL